MKKRFVANIILFLSIYLISSFSALSAENKSVKINIKWSNDIPSVENFVNSRQQFYQIHETNSGYEFRLQFDLNEYNNFNYSLSNVLWLDGNSGKNERFSNINGQVAVDSRKKYGVIAIPLEEKDAFINKKIESFDININFKQTLSASNNRVYAGNSVLSTGDWYKFGIPANGVYKLSYSFLKELGIDVDNVPVNNFSIFGHNGGMLPKLAGAERIDDLQEIPIEVVSSSSTLQENDYILFYGEGPEKWTYNESKDRFQHSKHLYSDDKTYFITTNNGTGKRISLASSPIGNASITFSKFDDYTFLEEDLVNLNQSGTDWFGDEFGINLQRNYNFSFPNIDANTPIVVDARLVARASTTSSFNIQNDGNNIVSVSLSGVNLSSHTAEIGKAKTATGSFNSSNSDFQINVIYNQPNFNASGWLDYLALNATRNLQLANNQMAFRVIDAADHNIVAYNLSNVNAQTTVWDVSDLFNISKINTTINGSVANFKAEGNSIKEYVAFNTINNEPTAYGKINNQNLHALADADMLIVVRAALLSYANDLANFHFEQEGLTTHVVTLEQVFNEFSSGTTDITAVRDFFKMMYEIPNSALKYALLFGDGTFNNKALGTFDVPTFQSAETLETLETFVSDDFFGFLDDSEGENITSTTNKLDIAVGRIPANSTSDANIAIEKIKRYYSEATYGNWRSIGTYIADDEDYNLHFTHAEENANNFIEDVPKMNIVKVYLDAYRQAAGSGGGFYPDVNEAIDKLFFKGSLFFNYIGHGGINGLAEERIVRLEDIDAYDNYYKMPLFISATCEFTRYDDFENFSAGERLFFKEDGGAIALVTTVRLVFASKNRLMNLEFMKAMKDGIADRSLTLGDITKIAKNNTLTGSGNRKFTLIGDPALKLAFPNYNVVSTKINENDFTSTTDTLKALTKVTIEGEVRDASNQLLTNFNGLVYPTVYDKVRTLSTLANDEESSEAPFKLQNNIIYAGKVQAIGGKFSYTFVVPKDIIYSIGDGKISYYANNSDYDAAGVDTVLVGGGGELDSNSIDNDDPIVEVYMDNESFVSGDFTTESPDLLVHLYDDNGINTVGSGVGHDIVAVLDDDTENGIILNDFYESELDSYQSGKVLYPLEKIPEGTHTVSVKAWDVFNNSGEGSTEFVVAESAELALDHVLNYPNPFTTSTQFMFEHNRKGDVLDVRIEIFTVSGKVVKTIQETALSEERRVELHWDGLDQYGDTIGKGVYVYRVTVKDSSGEKVDAFQKLVLLR